MSRRQFVGWIVSGGLGVSALLVAVTSRAGSFGRVLSNFWGASLDTRSPRGSLTEDELAEIIALGSVLIPEDETPGAGESWVRDYVNDKTENEAGYLLEYRTAARLLNRITTASAGEPKRFHELSPEERDSLLRATFHGEGSARPSLRRIVLFHGERKRKLHFWEIVVRGMIRDFYDSPAGWAAVGYDTYPGVPGDPRAYTEAVDLLERLLSDGHG